MNRTVLSILTLVLVAGVGAGQPPLPGLPVGGQPSPKKFPFSKGSVTGPRASIIELDETVEDPRPFLGGLLGKQVPKDVNPKDLKDLLDKLNKLPKDQQPDKAQLEELLKSPAFKDPKFLEQLDKMLRDPDFPKNLEGKLPDGNLPDKEQGQELADKLKEVMESGKQQGGANPEIPKGMEPPKIDPSAVDPWKVPTPEAKNPYADNEWVKWMEKNFGDSPAAQDAVKDLVNSLQKGDLKGMFDDVPELKNSGWKNFADWGKSNGLDLSNVKPPDVSTSKSGPTIGGSSGGSSWPSGGSGSGGGSYGGGGVGLGGGGTALAVIAGVAGALFLALLLFRRWKLDQARRAAQGAGGPNGFDYDSVRTREELVRAFDHVSLNQIGEDARSWNHRVIADQFAEVKPAHAVPAVELAGLYERARYAPSDEDLSAGDFADARRDLRAIAETPA